MPLREFLVDTLVHMPPDRILDGLTPEQAAQMPAPGLHSVAEIVAHLEFWQAWFLDRCDGRARPMAARAAEGWPPVSAREWRALLDRFASGLRRAAALGDDEARLETPVAPAIEFPPLARYTLRDALTHVAQHNAHHLGQVVTARQLLGCWPPPQGSWTW